MPANISGSSFSSLGINFSRKSSCWGRTEEVLKCTMGGRSVSFSTDHMNKQILSTVSRQSTKDLLAWKKDEKVIYPSRLVNIGIDKYCAENNTNVTGRVRQRVFAMISKDFGIKLDARSAQSSINHIITGNGSFGKKTASLCEGMDRGVKNKAADMLANQLADIFFGRAHV